MPHYEMRVLVNGEFAAGVSGRDLSQVQGQAAHYAVVYQEEADEANGGVVVEMRAPGERKWRRVDVFNQALSS